MLPDGWRWERLGSYVSSGGASVTPARSPETDFQLYSVPSHPTGRPEVVKGRAVGSSKQSVSPDDVLLCKINPRINRVWKVSDHGTGTLIASTEWIRFAADPELSPDYLRYYLTRGEVREYLAMNVSGVGGSLMRVRPATVEPITIPVPRREVQDAIVARIDALFTELEEGEAALRRARNDIATWRKTLLKAAVTGELTADWRAANPPTETGEDLLARILADRRTRWHADPRNKGKRFAEPVGPDGSGLPDLPVGWTWASVAQLGGVVTGGTPPPSDPENYVGTIPFFTPGDLDAGFQLTTTKRTLSAAGLASVRSIPARSILVTCIGATIGKVGFNAEAGATNQQINTLVPAVPALAEYLFWYFDGLGRHLVVDGASSTTMPILNKGDFSRLAVPLPPLSEAEEIARLVRIDVDAAIELEFVVEDSDNASAALRQSILAAAFRGKLAV